jgi:hypothetical protein
VIPPGGKVKRLKKPTVIILQQEILKAKLCHHVQSQKQPLLHGLF